MKVRILASGGFAGFEENEVARLDTKTLPAERRQRIEALIDQLSDSAKDMVGADLLRYTVEIEDAAGRRRTVVNDTGEPDSPLQRLLAELAGD